LYASLSIVRVIKGDQIKEDGMGRTCSTQGRGEKCI